MSEEGIMTNADYASAGIGMSLIHQFGPEVGVVEEYVRGEGFRYVLRQPRSSEGGVPISYKKALALAKTAVEGLKRDITFRLDLLKEDKSAN